MDHTEENSHAAPPEEARLAPGSELPPLPFAVRLGIHVVGWLLVLVGVAGLFLPGLQGLLMIAAGLAVVSLGSETLRQWLEPKLQRWPRLWQRMERVRHRLHERFGRD